MLPTELLDKVEKYLVTHHVFVVIDYTEGNHSELQGVHKNGKTSSTGSQNIFKEKGRTRYPFNTNYLDPNCVHLSNNIAITTT